MANFFNTVLDVDRYVIARYYIESRLRLKDAAAEIAKEESTGTWTDVPREKKIHRLYAARVVRVDYKNSTADIAFPIANFSNDIGGIPILLSTIAGNLFGLKKLKNVRLIDFHLPRAYVRDYKGPKIGIHGLRKMLGTTKSKRAHVGTIIKPKIGLQPKEQADVFYEAALGGIDCGKDDETLSNQKFCRIEERTRRIAEVIDRIKEETGRNVLYAINVTTRADKLLETVDRAVANGATMLMIDAVCAGFSCVQAIAETKHRIPLLVHRAGHAAFDRNQRHGIDNMIIAKISRLAGGDLIHTGAVGKMAGNWKEIQCYDNFLRGKWFNLKPAMPVASGGLHAGLVEKNIRLLGNDIQLQAGGGVHSHPLGTKAGAMSMRQAVEAAAKGIPLNKYAKEHRELDLAIRKWGYFR